MAEIDVKGFKALYTCKLLKHMTLAERRLGSTKQQILKGRSRVSHVFETLVPNT